MKNTKQLQVIEYLRRTLGVKYKVDYEKGVIYYFVKKDQSWREIKPTKLPTGYKQLQFSCGGLGKFIQIYYHQFVIMAFRMEHQCLTEPFPEGLVIDHIDSNKDNNSIYNLRLTTLKTNNRNSGRRDSAQGHHTAEVIAQVRKLHSQGVSQSEVAKRLGLPRITVNWMYRKITISEPFKKENTLCSSSYHNINDDTSFL